MIVIGSKAYELITDHKNGWNQEVFRERYSDVLDRYDYIVGDWGYNQLRLRGFFKDTNPKATKESVISSIQDYLNEYCNFGCAYFVVERVAGRYAPEGEDGDTTAAEAEAARMDDTAAGADDMTAYTHRAEALQMNQPPLRTHMRPQHRPRHTHAAQANVHGAGSANQSQSGTKLQTSGLPAQQQQGVKHPLGQQNKQGQFPQQGGKGQQVQQGQQGQQSPSNQHRGKPHHGGRPQHQKGQHANAAVQAKQHASTGQAQTNRHQ
jgi:uncharacterized protein YutD